MTSSQPIARPLKVALICDHFLPRVGGIELHVMDLARELLKHGQEARVVTATPGEENIDGVRIHRLKASLLPGSKIIWNTGALRDLQKLLKEERFDVLHCHSSVVSPLAYGGVFLARKGCPSVLTVHSLLNHTSRVFRSLDPFLRWSRWPVVLTGVSGAVAEGIRKAAPKAEVLKLPNGIYPEEWRVTPIASPETRITTVMRLHRKKRPQELLKAIPQILKQAPSSSFLRFTFIGDGPERKKLESLAKELGLESHVEFLGYLPRDRIKEVFSRTQLFVLPTVKEAFGIAILEARSAGLPVVAMNHGGTGDLIESGREGYLANTTEEFVRRSVEILTDAFLRKRMAENTREGLHKFHWDSVIARHLEIYRAAISKAEAFSNGKEASR
ncbi:MAG: glycosyltransferase family 4 protein [bacterium]